MWIVAKLEDERIVIYREDEIVMVAVKPDEKRAVVWMRRNSEMQAQIALAMETAGTFASALNALGRMAYPINEGEDIDVAAVEAAKDEARAAAGVDVKPAAE